MCPDPPSPLSSPPGRSRWLHRASATARLGGRAAHRALGVIEVTTKVAAVATGLVFGTAVFLGVVYRYVFASPFPYATELPRVLFPWFIMMGAVLAAARNEHLRLEVVTSRLPRRVQLTLLLLTSGLVIFSFWVFVEVAVAMLPAMHRASTPLLRWPVSTGFASVPVGLAGIALCVALRLVVQLTSAETKRATEPGVVGGW